MPFFRRPFKKKVVWEEENILSVNNIRFYIMQSLLDKQRVESTCDQFFLYKPAWLVKKYMKILDAIPTKNVMEIGILKGGSSAFYHAYCNPEKLVAIEYQDQPVAALQEYIKKKKCLNKLKPYYGVNQADERVKDILKDEFPNRDIDVVVDDASHMYEETKRSFNMIFPYIRKGGMYIIEDWSWAHAPHDLWQKADGKWSDKPALTNLIFEIIMACNGPTEIIDEVIIDKNNAFIKKGHDRAGVDQFDISKSYLTRGKKFVPFL